MDRDGQSGEPGASWDGDPAACPPALAHGMIVMSLAEVISGKFVLGLGADPPSCSQTKAPDHACRVRTEASEDRR
jgi:hypothetical protein